MKIFLRSALAVLAVVLLVGSVQAGDGYQHQKGLIATVSADTVDQQREDFGSWVRACSSGTITALDSGDVVTALSGIVELSSGQELWFGLDTAGGDVDTSYGYSNVSCNWPAWGKVKMPFYFTYVATVDSNGAVLERVAVFATKGSTDRIVIENVKLEVYVIGAKND